jgi:hypothetical protein
MIKRVSLPSLLIAFIILLAFLLRFYRINENIIFNGELGQNYLAIKDAYVNHQIPLLGPPTSHSWLSFGPLFYYIFGPFLVLNKWRVNTGPYFFGVISVLGILANYYLVKKYLDVKTALISSYLLTVLPSWIGLARESRFFSMVAYLFYPFLLLVLKISNKLTNINLFLLGLIFGVMINFHLTPIFLLPTILLLFFSNRKKINKKNIFFALIGFIIPNIPFLIYNLKTHFGMLTKFAVWIPYRSVIYHNFNLLFTLNEIVNFFGGVFVMAIILYILFKERKVQIVQTFGSFLFFGIIALILHKDPPSHYFYVLYPIPIILVSVFLTKLKYSILIPILILITVVSFTYLFSDKWFYVNQSKIQDKSSIVPYKMQVNAMDKVIKDADGKPFNLKRVGYSDKFEDYYEQNYDYILWLKGNQPKSYNVNLSYTIIEYPNMQIVKETK